MVFGVFESAVGSEVEVGLAKQASIDNFAAAVYDVREKLGPILFASRDVEEFRHKVAMMKADQSVYKIIQAHTFPLPKVIRRIVGKNSVLEQEFLQRHADNGLSNPVTAGRIACWPGCHENEGHAAKFHSKDKEGRYRHRQAAPPGFGGDPGVPHPDLIKPDGGSPSFYKVPTVTDFSNWPDANPAHGGSQPSSPGNPPVSSGHGPNPAPDGLSGTNNPTPILGRRRYHAADPTASLPGVAIPGQPGDPNANLPIGDGGLNTSPGPVATPGSTIPTPTGGTLGLNPIRPTGRRHADFESVQDIDDTFEDHQGQVLKPKGDFKGYLKKMDQGAPAKVKRNFASRKAVNVYLAWCQAHNLSAARLSSLDRYATNLSTADYFRLANVVLAWDDEHHPKVPSTNLKKKDKVAGQASGYGVPDHPNHPRHQSPDWEQQGMSAEEWNKADRPGWVTNNPNKKASQDPMRPYLAWCQKHGLRYISARNINRYAARDPQLAYFLAMRCKEAIRTARRRYAEDATYTPGGTSAAGGDILTPVGADHLMSGGTYDGPPIPEPKFPGGIAPGHVGRRRHAAPDYLQKADDALTQLLNQKAQEFQETIAPLQQALITVQQAEQLQQQQNPLNVLPPPGTVNVMPGQSDSTPGQLGMPDPNQPDISGLVQALQPGGGAMGGIAPQGGDGGAGAPPPAAAGGGLPPDLDQSAQRAARRRGGQGKVPGAGRRPRQAAGVGELWDRWKSRRGDEGDALRGGDVDYERFQTEHGVGDRALQNLKKRNETPDFAPINGVGRGRSSQGITVGRRRQAKSTDDFYTYNDRGQNPVLGPKRSNGWELNEDATSEEWHKGPHHVVHNDGSRGHAPGWYAGHQSGEHSGPHPSREKAQVAAESLGLRQSSRKQAWTGWGPAVFPKTRKVAGWDWDEHLNGYLANKPQHFACECGDSFPTPSGFQRCACGRHWNSYVIGTGGSNREAAAEKFIVREVPVHPNRIVANRKLALRKGAPFAGYEDFEDCESKNSDKGRPDAYCGEIKHRTEDTKKAYRRLVDPRTGTIHNLIDPGEVGEGEDPNHPTFRQQPKDWAKRMPAKGNPGQFSKRPIG